VGRRKREEGDKTKREEARIHLIVVDPKVLRARHRHLDESMLHDEFKKQASKQASRVRHPSTTQLSACN
jgi:hypothetical protein